MLSDKLHKALNDQMNFEFYSAHTYLAMAAYCTAENYDGFANFYLVQAEEERFHAMKFYNFINDMGYRATISGFEHPGNDFNPGLDTCKTGLSHEKEVTRRLYHLADIALEEREHVEEEASFDNLIQRLERIQGDSNAVFMLDNELASRKFDPAAQ